jgi:putative addiction module component (TIGR02574 family)
MNKALRDQVMSLPADEKYELVMDELMQFSPSQRLAAAHQLWESLSESDRPPPSEAQIAEAERRLDEHLRDPDSAIPYEEVMERLWTRSKCRSAD